MHFMMVGLLLLKRILCPANDIVHKIAILGPLIRALYMGGNPLILVIGAWLYWGDAETTCLIEFRERPVRRPTGGLGAGLICGL